jgi:hypothetical protein
MDIHHDTSFRSILADDFIFSTSIARIYSCLGQEQSYGWLWGHLFIHFTSHTLFSPQHYLLISIWSNPRHLHMWMWTWVEHIWHTLNSLPIWRSLDSHTWCHLKCHVCPRLRKWARYMEILWYTLTSKVSLQDNLYRTQKDQVFIVDVVVIDPM